MHRPLNHTVRPDGQIVQAIKLACPQSGKPFNDITYYVVKTASQGDKRLKPRWRTRLRSGMILDPRNGFSTDCQVYDRSETGARLRLHADVSIPANIRLYEDARETPIDAWVVWRKNHEIGIWFAPGARQDLANAGRAGLRAGYTYARK